MTQDQYTFSDPTTRYPKADESWAQRQSGPGLDEDLPERADHGERTYRGSGRLEGRKALITGADSGIGRATAIAFAREGADVVLSYLPEEEADAKEVAELVREAGRRAVTFPGDLKDAGYCQDLVETAVRELGGLDIVVSNAGKQQFTDDITQLTDEQFDETFKTNVYATFRICRAAVPHLPPGSTIITTTSIQAYQPSPILLDYASTKAAITTFTKALAQQLAPKGIRVNAVAPGPIWTPLQVAGGQPEEKLPAFGEQTPLGRPGQPAEMAPLFVFLASPESSYVTGATLHGNGGSPMP